jgi:hypothetical protein
MKSESQPAQFVFGIESRTDPKLSAYGLSDAEMALSELTLVTEQVGLQFRVEVFNTAIYVPFLRAQNCSRNLTISCGERGPVNPIPRDFVPEVRGLEMSQLGSRS